MILSSDDLFEIRFIEEECFAEVFEFMLEITWREFGDGEFGEGLELEELGFGLNLFGISHFYLRIVRDLYARVIKYY